MKNDREYTMRKLLVAALTITGLAFCTAAVATPVTWHVTGEVATGNAGNFFFPFQVNPGDPIAFDFSFESQTACVTCEDTLRTYENPLSAFTLMVGDTAFALPVGSSTITLRNDWPSPAGFFIDAFTLNLLGTDPSGISFSSDLAVQNTASSVPVAGINDVRLANLLPPDSSVFADPTLSFFNFGASFDGGFDSFGGHFLTSSVVSVPEPAALALLLPGLMLAWLVRAGALRKLARRRPDHGRAAGSSSPLRV
jgi:hypothetical protein